MKKVFLLIAFAFISWSAGAQTQIWGTCSAGGATKNAGTIFTADGNGNNLHKVYDFDSIYGRYPTGIMTLANNGNFYGVTEYGGFGDSCVVYKFNPVTGVYSDIHDLYQFQNLGYGTVTGMINATNGNLYGLCPDGGANGYGVIYKVDPATDIYSDIFDFTSTANGQYPNGSLMQATDGNFYATAKGGSNGTGLIFRFNPATLTYTKLYDFDSLYKGGSGIGSLFQASNGKLYGTCIYTSGSTNLGVIYSFDIATSTFVDLHDYAFPIGITFPVLSEVIQASDGKLYGAIDAAFPITNTNSLFNFDINNNTFNTLFVFTSASGYHSSGLKEGSSGKLFGTTFNGGIHNAGVVYTYDIVFSTYTKIFDFDGNNSGSNPDCEITITPELTTGIFSQLNNPSVKTYPNPATTTVTISISSFTANRQLIITDVLGREIERVTITNNQSTINVAQWNNGVYFYQLIDDKETKAGKFVVSH